MPLDWSPAARKLLADVQRYIGGRRWRAAVRTYEAAERLVYSSLPTIHEAQQRRDAARGGRAVADLHEQGTKARQDAATREKAAFRAKYEELVRRRPGLTASSASEILAIDGIRAASTIRRYLTKADPG